MSVIAPSRFFDPYQPALQGVVGPHTRLWRYISFTKFVSLLSTESLWFSMSSLLGDPWEGAHTKANLARRRAEAEEVGRDDDFLTYMGRIARSIYVNCWHLNGSWDRWESHNIWRPTSMAVASAT